MTYVQYINCDRWKKVIGISLWIGTTIGLGIGLIIGYEGSVNPLIIPLKPNIYNSTQTTQDYTDALNSYYKAKNTNENNAGLFILCLAGNLVNYPFILYALNKHYQWIEIKCGNRPTTEAVK